MNTKRWLTLCVAIMMAISLVLVAACDETTHEHDYQWDYNETEHWMVCEEDNTIDESTRGAHKLVNSICVCGYMHIHAYTEWDFDELQHWKVCPTDDAIQASSYAEHVFNDKCECVCGATNHEFGYNYTADTVPAPVADGGKLTATCTKCGESTDVDYDFGVADATVVELDKNGTYYVSGDATGVVTFEFDVTIAGRYEMSLKDMVYPVSDSDNTIIHNITDVLVDSVSIMSNGELDVAYQGKMSITQDLAIKCDFDEEDVGKKVGITFTFLSGEEAILPYVLIEFAATEASEVPDGKITAHFYNTGNWESVFIHAWDGGGDLFGSWPGQQVTDVVDGWYTVTFDASEGVGIIFNNGGNGAQTKDLFPLEKEVWVTIDSQMFYTRAEAVAHAAQLKPIGSDAFFLVGKVKGDEDWSETTSDYSRVLPAEDNYSLTISLLAGDQFKIKQNVNGWDVEFGYQQVKSPDTTLFSAGGGYGTDIMVSKNCTVTITLNPSARSITIVVVSLD